MVMSCQCLGGPLNGQTVRVDALCFHDGTCFIPHIATFQDVDGWHETATTLIYSAIAGKLRFLRAESLIPEPQGSGPKIPRRFEGIVDSSNLRVKTPKAPPPRAIAWA